MYFFNRNKKNGTVLSFCVTYMSQAVHPRETLLESYAHQDMVLLLSPNGTHSPIFTNWLRAGKEFYLFLYPDALHRAWHESVNQTLWKQRQCI